MLIEATDLIGRQCYTDSGIYLGSISNVVIDVDEAKVNGIFIGEPNPNLVEGGVAVNVPYRWVKNVGDIILLKYFPEAVGKKEKRS